MTVHVVAGALLNDAGHVLIAQRPPGKHMAGGWEFPGGKLDADEAPYAGLVRELQEELGVEVDGATFVISYRHAYADRSVLLELWLVTQYRGVPYAREAQPLKWVAVDALADANLLAADQPMIVALQALLKKP